MCVRHTVPLSPNFIVRSAGSAYVPTIPAREHPKHASFLRLVKPDTCRDISKSGCFGSCASFSYPSGPSSASEGNLGYCRDSRHVYGDTAFAPYFRAQDFSRVRLYRFKCVSMRARCSRQRDVLDLWVPLSPRAFDESFD